MGKREDMRGKSRIAEDNRAGGEGGEWGRMRRWRRKRVGRMRRSGYEQSEFEKEECT